MESAIEVAVRGMNSQGRDILLIGGHALPAYGVVRQTVDVDFLIVDADENNLKEILLTKGYTEEHRSDLFIRYCGSTSDYMDVDVLLVDQATFNTIFENSNTYEISSLSLHIPSMDHLIALKLHAIKNDPRRELKDLLDIVELLRQNPDLVQTEELKTICQQYGPDKIYQKLEHYR